MISSAEVDRKIEEFQFIYNIVPFIQHVRLTYVLFILWNSAEAEVSGISPTLKGVWLLSLYAQNPSPDDVNNLSVMEYIQESGTQNSSSAEYSFY